MRFLSQFVLFAVTCVCVRAASAPAAPSPSTPGIVTLHGRLQVAGNRIVGQDGQPVSLAGISFGWSQWEAARFYNAGTVDWLKQDWHAQIVRAALGLHREPGSYLQKPAANEARVTKVVDAAIAADLYVIIDWHDHHAHEHTDLAVAFFSEMARRYGDRPNVIYEIFNEPERISWRGDIKPYAEKVIAAIRAIDPDNLIVVGTPVWSQDVDIAAADPIQDPNVAYTLHFYAGSHKQKLRDKAAKALAAGAALFVTEWGTCDASGDGPIDDASVRVWMDFIRANQLSHCNWAVYDKRETAALLLRRASAKGRWTEKDLSPSGKYVRDLVRNWNSSP